ncbi:hypothetical protein J4233_05030 [Candidatus Pacearchaeota archaeon]|nr:hypothetical protein [Candidatus Pacearchaeota archaeon]
MPNKGIILRPRFAIKGSARRVDILSGFVTRIYQGVNDSDRVRREGGDISFNYPAASIFGINFGWSFQFWDPRQLPETLAPDFGSTRCICVVGEHYGFYFLPGPQQQIQDGTNVVRGIPVYTFKRPESQKVTEEGSGLVFGYNARTNDAQRIARIEEELRKRGTIL